MLVSAIDQGQCNTYDHAHPCVVHCPDGDPARIALQSIGAMGFPDH
jgi:hypothetical protein